MAEQTEEKQARVGHEPQASNGGPPVSSFAKSLFLGEIHEPLVFPYPKPDPEEQERIRGINDALRGFAEGYDARLVEEERWIPDEKLAELGEIGALGLYVDE